MRLDQMDNFSAEKLNQILKEKLGWNIDLNKISVPEAYRLIEGVEQRIALIKKSHQAHSAEKSPQFMGMLLSKQVLEKYISESLDLSAQIEALYEDELNSAQSLLAAKDMVDTIQGMVEDASKMLNEQLPALADNIRTNVSVEAGDSFKSSATSTLSSLLAALQSARESMDQAVRGMTSGAPQPMEQPSMNMGAPAGDMGMGDDMGDIEPMDDEFGASDAAIGGVEDLGRERRESVIRNGRVVAESKKKFR